MLCGKYIFRLLTGFISCMKNKGTPARCFKPGYLFNGFVYFSVCDFVCMSVVTVMQLLLLANEQRETEHSTDSYTVHIKEKKAQDRKIPFGRDAVTCTQQTLWTSYSKVTDPILNLIQFFMFINIILCSCFILVMYFVKIC